MASVQRKKSWCIEMKDGSSNVALPNHLSEWINNICDISFSSSSSSSTSPSVNDILPSAHVDHPSYYDSGIRTKAYLDIADFQTFIVEFRIIKKDEKEKNGGTNCAQPTQIHFCTPSGLTGAACLLSVYLDEFKSLPSSLIVDGGASSVQEVLVRAKQLDRRPPVFSNLHSNNPNLAKPLLITPGEVVITEKELEKIDFLITTFENREGVITWSLQRSLFIIWKLYTIGNDLHQLLFIIFGCKNAPNTEQEIHKTFEYLNNYNPHWIDLQCLACFASPCSADTFNIYNANVLPSLAYAFESCLLRQICLFIFSVDDVVRAKGESDAFAFFGLSSMFSFANCHHLIMTVPEVSGLKQLYVKSGLSQIVWERYVSKYIASVLVEHKSGNLLFQAFMLVFPDKTILRKRE